MKQDMIVILDLGSNENPRKPGDADQGSVGV